MVKDNLQLTTMSIWFKDRDSKSIPKINAISKWSSNQHQLLKLALNYRDLETKSIPSLINHHSLGWSLPGKEVTKEFLMKFRRCLKRLFRRDKVKLFCRTRSRCKTREATVWLSRMKVVIIKEIRMNSSTSQEYCIIKMSWTTPELFSRGCNLEVTSWQTAEGIKPGNSSTCLWSNRQNLRINWWTLSKIWQSWSKS